MPRENLGHKRLRIFFSCSAIALGAADAWATRFTMNPDGVSYLDMADAWWRADWHMAINAYWSPLYSWILGLFLKVLKPSAYWEYPVVHLANLLIYVATVGCFEFLLCSFIRYRRQSAKDLTAEDQVGLPEWAWWTLGYTLFIWTSLILIGIRVVTPDMCVAGFVYLASGLILRIRTGAATRRTFVLLGAVLGSGYLAKAIMFPLAFVFLVVALSPFGEVRKVAPRIFVSAVIFCAIAGPFLVMLSRARGHLTFGESGKLVYEFFVDGVKPLFPKDSALRHPARRILETPAAYEFAEPIGGTYPPWYDPPYWHEGIEPLFNISGEVRALTSALIVYCAVFFGLFMQLNVTTGLLALYLVAPRPSVCVKCAATNWPLLAPALSTLGLYALVYTELRYIAEFVLLLWLAAFSGVRLPPSRGSRRLIASVVVIVALTTGFSAVWSIARNLADATNADPVYWKAASALHEEGIRPGDKLALIWDEEWEKGALGGTFVPRLAKTQVIAEVPRAEGFWTAAPPTQLRVIQALARTGAKAILTLGQPRASARDVSWERLGTTNYYLSVLEKRKP